METREKRTKAGGGSITKFRIKQTRQISVVAMVVLCFLTTASVRADWQQQQNLTAGDANQYDYFGYSVSIDGNYAIIGAHYDDEAAFNAGAAYIFRQISGTWTQQAKLTASDGVTHDNFGQSVSISGEYAIVGAYGKNTHTGAAYIFKRTGTSWNQEAILTASDGATSDEFGYSVSISGDYAIVGAYNDTDMGVNQCGSAYIFEKPSGGWADANETAKLLAYDLGPTSGERFGYCVAIDGNCTIVGADLSSPSAQLINSGVAYMFKREGIYWNPQPPKLAASDASAGDNFGRSVAIDGNYVIVGAPSDDIDAVNGQTGCAYIFKNVGGPVWTEQDILFANDPCMSDYFGSSVSVNGDYALAGTPAAFRPGAGYMFRRARVGTIWPLLDKLTVPDINSTDSFGWSVSVDGGYAIIGAYSDDDHGTAFTFEQICPTADLSGDCCVDYYDLTELCDSWLSSGPADWDGSGVVDFPDFAKLASEWLYFN